MKSIKKTVLFYMLAIDWLALLSGLIVLVFSLIIVAFLILGSQQYYNQLREWERQQGSEFGTIEAKYTELQETNDMVKRLYLTTFNQLMTEGFFQNNTRISIEEQRLKIFGDFKTVLPQLPLLTANYALSEKKRYTVPDFMKIEPQLNTYKTQLILNLGVLHEEDLLKSIEIIMDQPVVGLLNLESCDVKRLRDKVDVKEVSKPYFKASCVLSWYISKIAQK